MHSNRDGVQYKTELRKISDFIESIRYEKIMKIIATHIILGKKKKKLHEPNMGPGTAYDILNYEITEYKRNSFKEGSMKPMWVVLINSRKNNILKWHFPGWCEWQDP